MILNIINNEMILNLIIIIILNIAYNFKINFTNFF